VPEAEAAVESIRREHTPDGADGMPAHVTLLYPFTDSDHLPAGRINEVRDVLQGFSVFEIELKTLRWFENPGEWALWLAPDPPDRFVAMTQALVHQFPEHPPYKGKFAEVVPHLTVGVSASRGDLEPLLDLVEPHLPIKARIKNAGLYQHDPGGWKRRAQFALTQV
jgi:2'-5' RNA ligase